MLLVGLTYQKRDTNGTLKEKLREPTPALLYEVAADDPGHIPGEQAPDPGLPAIPSGPP
jgi:hypothetical protein